jgi:hypothetical protein
MIRDFTKHFLRHLSLKPLSRADWLHLHSELRTTGKKIPSTGELILAETHGLLPTRIVTSIKNYLAGEQYVDLEMSNWADTQAQQRMPEVIARVAHDFRFRYC